MLTDWQKEVLGKVLKIELAKPEYSGKTPEEIHAMLNEPKVIPGEDAIKSVPMTISGLLASLSQESIAKLVNWVHLTDLRNKISAQDIEGVTIWGQLLVAGGLISGSEFESIQSRLSQTQTVQGPATVMPPTMHDLLSGANLKAVLGDGFQKIEIRDGKPVIVSISMPNAIELDDLAEVISTL